MRRAAKILWLFCMYSLWARAEEARTDSTIPPAHPLYVNGRIVGDSGRPDMDRVVDLEIEHAHTITRTDRRGRFEFFHVSPKQFRLTISSIERNGFWKRTNFRGRWAEEIIDTITPDPGEHEIKITIETSHTPYRYFGRVTDADEKGIAGATVTGELMLHRNPGPRGDAFESAHITTNANGEWELDTRAHFLHHFLVEAPGFELLEKKYERSKMIPPECYDFSLSPGASR
jgi:hypothetical protein